MESVIEVHRHDLCEFRKWGSYVTYETRLAFKAGSSKLSLAFYWLSIVCCSFSGSLQFRVVEHEATTLVVLRLIIPKSIINATSIIQPGWI